MRVRLSDIVMAAIAALLMAPALFFAQDNPLLSVFAMVFISAMTAILSRRVFIVIASILLVGIFNLFIKFFMASSAYGYSYNMTLAAVLLLVGMVSGLLAFCLKDTVCGVIISSAVSGSLTPFLAFLLMDLDIRENMPLLASICIDYLVVGMAAGLLAALIWFFIRQNKSILMFMHSR